MEKGWRIGEADLCKAPGAQQEIGASAGYKSYCVCSGLHVLPEVNIGVVEDVRV